MDSTYEIDFDALYREGYRGIIFDIDNTLVPHGAPADERAKKLFAHLKELGFSCCLLSNNKEPRVKMFNDDVQVQYIFKAGKPKCFGYEKAMERMGATPCLSEIRSLRIFMEQTVQGSVRSWSAISIQKKRYRLY